MTPEGKVKNDIKKILKARGVYYAMPIGTGFGVAGVPDFLCCVRGKFLGIEAKAGNNKPTGLQLKHMADIRLCGGYAMVVNEDNMDELTELLEKLTHER